MDGLLFVASYQPIYDTLFTIRTPDCFTRGSLSSGTIHFDYLTDFHPLTRASFRALADESGRHWEQISSQRYEFASKETEVAALAGVSKSDVLAWLRRWLFPSSKTRRLLRVQVNSPKASATSTPMEIEAEEKKAGGKKPAKGAKKAPKKKAPSLVVIEDVEAWKKTAKVFPALLMPQPLVASAAL